MPRDVLIGCHSTVWRHVGPLLSARGCAFTAIGHGDTATFRFGPRDRTWVLSFSMDERENAALLQRLSQAAVAEIIYVSSSSTIIGDHTSCYRYPRVKLAAERQALQLARSKVLTIGLMYRDPRELPGGANAATSCEELAQFMAAPSWPAEAPRRKALLRIVEQPFRHGLERGAYRAYGHLMAAAGRLPCLLRPLDAALKALGARWYGYTYLSNKRWISTIS